MRLVIFDIDGTIMDSVNADDAAYIQTIKELYHINLKDVDWNSYTHVTDAGLTNEIFLREYGHLPESEDIHRIKSRYYDLLSARRSNFRAIRGAHAFIQRLDRDQQTIVGFATGGWLKTATLKFKTIGLSPEKYIFKTSDDHYDRTKIIECVLEEAKQTYQTRSFQSVTYFGDGVWDYKAAQKAGIQFIGVDYHRTGRLSAYGATHVIVDYIEGQPFLENYFENNLQINN